MLNRLPVNEIFETIQGEATYTGTPAVFVRLQGCPVGCPWCDTKHTWTVAPDGQVSIDDMLAKTGDSAKFAWMDERDILIAASKFNAGHIVLTGGEPALYDLIPLTSLLADEGYTVQLETSGTHQVRVDMRTFVTVSPKIDMPGGFKVRLDALQRANEIKLPVGKMADIERYDRLVDEHGPGPDVVWLQPLSQNPKATALCVQQAIARRWKISLQTHKYLGVR